MSRPTALPMPHQVVAATTTAAPSRPRPIPSRRCSGSRSRALLPTAPTAAPTACAASIHAAAIARAIHSIRITNGLAGGGGCALPRIFPFPPRAAPLAPFAGLPFPLAGRLLLVRGRDDVPAGGMREAVLPCGRVPLPPLGTRAAILTTVTRTRDPGEA